MTTPPRGKSNLLTLGSAAVLAVYAAGFFRTRAAAQRFSDDSDVRHPAIAPTPAVVSDSIPHKRDTIIVADATPHRIRTVVAAKPTIAVPVDSLVPVITAPLATAPRPPVPAAVPVIVDTTPPVPEKVVGAYKDGTYRGWGTSRHGDIEAAVDIKDGKIASAYITQCLTRYSCSWISQLPGQVTSRQSADVDYVSGATQSSNAFSHAIFEALSKAK